MGYTQVMAGLLALGLAGAVLACAVSAEAASDSPPGALTECGACHMVFPPQFLPQRSWAMLLGKLDDHFGEIASLTDDKKSAILAYLTVNAADGPSTGPTGQQFLWGLAPGMAPLRITDMPWWMGAHQEVSFAGIQSTPIKSASNCLGCHNDGGGDGSD